MREETNTIFANDVDEFTKYAHILNLFEGDRIRYIDHAYWGKLSKNLTKEIAISKIKEPSHTYTPLNESYNGHRFQCTMRVQPNKRPHGEGKVITALRVHFSYGYLAVDVLCSDMVYGKSYFRDTLLPHIKEFLKEYSGPPNDPNIVSIHFTHLTPEGDASVTQRDIICPAWNDIATNYPYTKNYIEALLALERPDNIGKFIFWYGPPGTGKSYLIRSLIREWKERIDCLYIMDPERFFNDASYMKEILIYDARSNSDEVESVFDQDDCAEDRDESEGNPSTFLKLYIIEDGLNFLLQESRGHAGGCMSRFLNLTDGILGQGLRHIFLVTSNEKIEEIDEAFLRTGRCLQELQFLPFKQEDAMSWLTEHGDEAPLWSLSAAHKKLKKTEFCLSDLYAILNNNSLPIQSPEKRVIGIGA